VETMEFAKMENVFAKLISRALIAQNTIPVNVRIIVIITGNVKLIDVFVTQVLKENFVKLQLLVLTIVISKEFVETVNVRVWMDMLEIIANFKSILNKEQSFKKKSHKMLNPQILKKVLMKALMH
jgi:hypothetical protein